MAYVDAWIHDATAYTTTLHGHRGQLVFIAPGFVQDVLPFMDSFALCTPEDNGKEEAMRGWRGSRQAGFPPPLFAAGMALTLVGMVVVLLQSKLCAVFVQRSTIF